MYFIVQDGQEHGPYDMVAMVRKVKNHSLTAETLLRHEAAPTAVPAAHIPELQSLFTSHAAQGAAHAAAPRQGYSIKASLISGWHFLQFNHFTFIITGLFLLAAALLILLALAVPVAGYVIATALALFLYSLYLFVLLKYSRSQSDPNQILKQISARLLPLFAFSALLALPLTVGLMLLVAPGLLLLTFYLFTPHLIIDRGYGVWAAMEASRRKMIALGVNHFSLMFGMVVLNFLAGAAAMIPLLVSLPLTAHVIAEAYDRAFSEI